MSKAFVLAPDGDHTTGNPFRTMPSMVSLLAWSVFVGCFITKSSSNNTSILVYSYRSMLNLFPQPSLLRRSRDPHLFLSGNGPTWLNDSSSTARFFSSPSRGKNGKKKEPSWFFFLFLSNVYERRGVHPLGHKVAKFVLGKATTVGETIYKTTSFGT